MKCNEIDVTIFLNLLPFMCLNILSACPFTICMQCPKSEENIRSPGIGANNSFERPCE